MRPVVKWLLGGCVVLLVICGVAVIFAVRWWSANKEQIRVKAEGTRNDGREFGRTSGDAGCVAKALDDYRTSLSILSEPRARIWLTGCFETSQPETAFCSEVPPTSEIGRTVAWRLSECSRHGLAADKSCTRILSEVQTYCASDKRRAKMR